jgi:hypothetical protein
MAALPQPGDQLPVLRRLRASRGTTGRPADQQLKISGSELATRAVVQVRRFGAEVLLAGL